MLTEGLAAIRAQYRVPADFPPEVTAAATEAAARAPTAHRDRTDMPFVTLDPASSTDLDQAFAIDRDGTDLLLLYAIADVAWFVDDGGTIDREAWLRGSTIYLPDGKAPLYPTVLSERAASLLPNVDRPAVIFSVRVDPDGNARLDGAERAVIRSRAKLAYATVTPADLPADFAELSVRVLAAEDRRGAGRVDPPEQEVDPLPDGRYRLGFRPRLESEDRNAALSLAANLAIADALQMHATGLFRVMAPPDARAISRLRMTAKALGLEWPDAVSLDAYSRTLSGADPRQAAFMLAVRRAGNGAGYQPYRAGVTPWHAAMAATYAQATAPLRRLADRYVILATLAIANGAPVPDWVGDAFERLPAVMDRADDRGSAVERAVVDLAEAVMLHGHEGETFGATVTEIDERGARIQLADQPVVARLTASGLAPGQSLDVRLVAADPVRRALTFAPA